MQCTYKYDNIETELPKLQKVLVNAIQTDFLEIQGINKECPSFQKAAQRDHRLQEASFVVYSKYIKKSEHKYEEFIFLDDEGHEVCHISGKEMELYGMLNPCMNLTLSEEYQYTHGSIENNYCKAPQHFNRH